MADMAEGVKALWSRPYFDKTRVGILRHVVRRVQLGAVDPAISDVWAAASASSSVTSWFHYDSIYTERYMWIPAGEQGRLRGRQRDELRQEPARPPAHLLRHRGQQRAPEQLDAVDSRAAAGGKSFEVQVGPDLGHTGVNNQRMWEFFIENLIQRPDRLMAPVGDALVRPATSSTA
jgi:dipeptidyl-peptidase-4